MHTSVCPFCGIENCDKLREEIALYTLQRRDDFFIHQVLVDAYCAQHATAQTKPIAITFALIGLYMVVELGKTGKDAQLAHMRLAKTKRAWPMFTIPMMRGGRTVADVLQAPPGQGRDRAILQWAASVWDAYEDQRERVKDLL